MLRLEFAHYDYKLRGTISAKDFALSMVASADSSHLSGLLDRVNRMDDKPHFRDIHITWEEFKDFDALRRKLLPFSLALFSYGKVNGFLTKNDFQRAACQVSCLSSTLLPNKVHLTLILSKDQCEEQTINFDFDEFCVISGVWHRSDRRGCGHNFSSVRYKS